MEILPARFMHEVLRTEGIALQRYSGYVNRVLEMHGPSDAVLLSFVMRGTGRHYVEDRVFEETGCSLGITHYGMQHDIITSEQGMDVMNIILDLDRYSLPTLPEPLQSVLWDLLPLRPSFSNRLNRLRRVSFEQPETALSLAECMLQEQVQQEPGWQAALHNYFHAFLVETCRAALQYRETPSTVSDSRLEQVRRLLESDFRGDHSLSALSAQVKMTPTSLSRAFKRYAGKAPLVYLLERRLREAAQQLRTTSEKVSTIAYDCGFSDVSYFNRKFREHFECTPASYRKLVE